MGDRLRRMLDDELSDQRPPSVTGLVGHALVDGQRIRRNRRIRAGALGVALCGVLLASVAMLAPWRPQAAPPVGTPGGTAAAESSAAADPAPAVSVYESTASPTPTAPSASPHGPVRPVEAVAATPAALLVRLIELLPSGRTSQFAGSGGARQIVAQLYLDRGQGPSLIKIEIPLARSQTRPLCPETGPDSATSCSITSNGNSVTVIDIQDECAESIAVIVQRVDGVIVSLLSATCRPDGTPVSVPAVQVLSVTEAVRVATDPAWGPTIDGRYVTEGAHQFPQLPPPPD